MSKALLKRIEAIEEEIKESEGKVTETVYGVVDKVEDGKPHICRKWKGTIGNMVETDEEPTILLAEVLEPAILKHKKYKCLYGGRAGTKSMFAMDVLTGEVNYSGSKVFCLRERMKSLKESIYAGIESRIDKLSYGGFTPVPSQWEIRHKDGGKFTFGGMQNIIDMKGSFNYKFFLMEEAARTTQKTIDTLGPTLRDTEGAELWYIWNPESSNDAMSKEFIIPFQAELDRNGYYEDDYHLIIKCGYENNPWFWGDDSLVAELQKDKEKVKQKRMSKARYNHIWGGDFNDGVEDGIIQEDWFDACIDAHVKLGFEPKGAVVTTHDVADVGGDEKTTATRHGVVFIDMQELETIDGNDAMDEACGIAISNNSDYFGYDGDGMGALLRRQVSENFKNKRMETWVFKGSNEVHHPEKVIDYSEEYGIKGAKKNKDVFKNRRAQRYIELAERMRKTYDCVMAKERGKAVFVDTDELISFSSNIDCLQKLRAELCKLPRKKNNSGMIELYSKADMKSGVIMSDGSRQVIPSPNLGDSVMMSFDCPMNLSTRVKPKMPTPLRPMGRR